MGSVGHDVTATQGPTVRGRVGHIPVRACRNNAARTVVIRQGGSVPPRNHECIRGHRIESLERVRLVCTDADRIRSRTVR
jgi:hypothetical protein